MPQEGTTKAARAGERGEQFWIELCGRPVPAKNSADGIQAVVISESVEACPMTKLDEHLEVARADTATLAHACPPRQLAAEAFALYEKFWPAVLKGAKRRERRAYFICGRLARPRRGRIRGEGRRHPARGFCRKIAGISNRE